MKTVFVIGHGASPQGKGFGELIDASEGVVRLHDWHWQLERPEDYGCRCDVAVIPGPWFDRARGEVEQVPAKSWACYTLEGQKRGRNYPPELFGRPLKVVTKEIDDAFRWLRPFVPTRGGAALILASMTYPDARIVGFGFDSLVARYQTPYADDCPAGANPVYLRMLGQEKNSRHDFSREIFGVARWFRLRGRSLEFLGDTDAA